MIELRPVSWLRGALREFQAFPVDAQIEFGRALSIAARGGKAESAKSFKGVGSGVFEIALRHRKDAYRVIYAVQLGDALWVIHAFQKKSKTGIKTPQMQVDLVKHRLTRLRETLT